MIFILASVFLSIFPFVPKESEEFPFYLPSLTGLLFIVSGLPVWWLVFIIFFISHDYLQTRFMIRGKGINIDIVKSH